MPGINGKLFLLCVFVVCYVCIFCEAAEASKNGVMKMDESVLQRRFGEFSTNGAYVLLLVSNGKTGEQMFAVMENTSWFSVCKNVLKIVSNSKEYTAYMVKNYNKVFVFDDDYYKKLKNRQADDSFLAEGEKGLPYIIDRYFTTENGYYYVKEKELSKNFAFLRILLQQNIVVRIDCYDGSIYIDK